MALQPPAAPPQASPTEPLQPHLIMVVLFHIVTNHSSLRHRAQRPTNLKPQTLKPQTPSGIVHYDLKPSNVLLKSSTVDSRGFTCKVCVCIGAWRWASPTLPLTAPAAPASTPPPPQTKTLTHTHTHKHRQLCAAVLRQQGAFSSCEHRSRAADCGLRCSNTHTRAHGCPHARARARLNIAGGRLWAVQHHL